MYVMQYLLHIIPCVSKPLRINQFSDCTQTMSIHFVQLLVVKDICFFNERL